MVRSGRAGSSRFWVLYMKTKFVCSMELVPKINTKRDMRCCGLPYVTGKGGSRLRAILRFAQRRLQLFVTKLKFLRFYLHTRRAK